MKELSGMRVLKVSSGLLTRGFVELYFDRKDAKIRKNCDQKNL